MSHDRGGRRIRLIVEEYAYPHSNSAKANCVGQVFPIYDSKNGEAKHRRISNVIEEFVLYAFETKLFEEATLLHALSNARLTHIGKTISEKPKSKV